MKAIILAAGVSSRMYPITLKKPKCLLELEPGKTIIEHQIDMLKRCGVDDIIVIVGYLKDEIKDLLKDKVRYKEFKDFSKYNNLHTLYSIKEELDDDIVVMYSDVVFGESLLRKCVESKEDFCLLVHNKDVLKDTAKIKIKDNGVGEVGNHISMEEADGNFVGIAKFSKEGVKVMVDRMAEMVKDKKHDNDYYIIAINEISKKMKIGYEFAEDEPWIEIDFLEYYERAKKEIYPLVK
jgi:choline kinase|tara:strand:+ start:1209 stop:1919 length:711 start_codon:yes stop_codon:yes gene_type:complete